MPSLIKPPKRHEDLPPRLEKFRANVVNAFLKLLPCAYSAAISSVPLTSSATRNCAHSVRATQTPTNATSRSSDVIARNNNRNLRGKGEWGLYKHARLCGQRTCVFVLPHLTKTLILDDDTQPHVLVLIRPTRTAKRTKRPERRPTFSR